MMHGREGEAAGDKAGCHVLLVDLDPLAGVLERADVRRGELPEDGHEWRAGHAVEHPRDELFVRQHRLVCPAQKGGGVDVRVWWRERPNRRLEHVPQIVGASLPSEPACRRIERLRLGEDARFRSKVAGVLPRVFAGL